MLFTEAESTLARAVGELSAGNPFLPERLEAERAVLGEAFDPAGTLWHSPAEPEPAPNVVRIAACAATLADAARERLAGGARPRAEEVGLYEDLVLYALYERHQGALFAPAGQTSDERRPLPLVPEELALQKGCASSLPVPVSLVMSTLHGVVLNRRRLSRTV